MADLKDLQKMAKEGKISEELLKDDKFKAELKRILKEECKVEITDEDIPEIVKDLEENLKETPDDTKAKQVLSEEEVENVAGGVSKAKVIKGVSVIAGYILGYKGSGKIYMSKFASDNYKRMNSYEKGSNERKKLIHTNRFDIELNQIGDGIFSATGGLVTSYASYKLADYLCKKFDIK